MEEWRDIAGYEGRYQVSNMGRVRSLRAGEYSAKKVSRYGARLIVYLNKGGIGKRVGVSSLIAQAFPGSTVDKAEACSVLVTPRSYVEDVATEIILALKRIGPVINFNDTEQTLNAYSQIKVLLTAKHGRS